MTTEISFKYSLEQSVWTCFGSPAIVMGLFYDAAGNQYNVRTEEGDKWFLENQISDTPPGQPFKK